MVCFHMALIISKISSVLWVPHGTFFRPVYPSCVEALVCFFSEVRPSFLRTYYLQPSCILLWPILLSGEFRSKRCFFLRMLSFCSSALSRLRAGTLLSPSPSTCHLSWVLTLFTLASFLEIALSGFSCPTPYSSVGRLLKPESTFPVLLAQLL